MHHCQGRTNRLTSRPCGDTVANPVPQPGVRLTASFLNLILSTLRRVMSSCLTPTIRALRHMSLPAPSGQIPRSKISPKQPSSRQERDWYPYYAGFTERFVEAVLSEYLVDSKRILDPWSGSGTTVSVAMKRGTHANGVDINPALTVIARARVLSVSMKPHLFELARDIIETTKHIDAVLSTSDLLVRWITPDAVLTIRRIQHAIHTTCETAVPRRDILTIVDSVDRLSPLVCFFYTALFFVVRNTLRRFATSNPMWLKTPNEYHQRVSPDWNELLSSFFAAVTHFGSLLSSFHENFVRKEAPFVTGDVAYLSYGSNTFDAVLTSPPYATRLDYIKGTIPELGVLGADDTALIDLRRRATGSPVVNQAKGCVAGRIVSSYGCELLDKIKGHPSKGSRSYYHPWMRNYLGGLQRGLEQIDRVVDRSGRICVVIQDSRYKEIHINLQRIVVETLQEMGRGLAVQVDHSVRHPRVQLAGPPAKEGLVRSYESLLVFD